MKKNVSTKDTISIIKWKVLYHAR